MAKKEVSNSRDVDTVVKYKDVTKRLQLKKGESKELFSSFPHLSI